MTEKYENTLFYQLNSLTKYFNLIFENHFKEGNYELSTMEHLAIIVINDTADICQRDLAKILVKDRANTGKIAQSLEKKGFVKINLSVKNNRPVKILSLTAKGKKIYKKTIEKINPIVENIYSEISKEEIDSIKAGLKKFKTIVEKATKTNI